MTKDLIDVNTLAALEHIEAGIGHERSELREIRDHKEDHNSYAAGYSTGYIQAMLEIRKILKGEFE